MPNLTWGAAGTYTLKAIGMLSVSSVQIGCWGHGATGLGAPSTPGPGGGGGAQQYGAGASVTPVEGEELTIVVQPANANASNATSVTGQNFSIGAYGSDSNIGGVGGFGGDGGNPGGNGGNDDGFNGGGGASPAGYQLPANNGADADGTFAGLGGAQPGDIYSGKGGDGGGNNAEGSGPPGNGTSFGGGGGGAGSTGNPPGAGADGGVWIFFSAATPEPTGVSPASGATAGGTSITITGNPGTFSTGCNVLFSSHDDAITIYAVNVVVVDSSTITCETPDAQSAGFTGLSTISVINGDSVIGQLVDGFNFTDGGGGISKGPRRRRLITG